MFKDKEINLLSHMPKTKYDVVTCQHILEHYSDPQMFMDEVIPLIKKGGTLILVVPLNDVWPEHQTVWTISDVSNLLNEYECRYKLIHRPKTIRLKSDNKTFVEEVIAIVNF
jgi:2-polyprenyl-3-methyl-5-hydroxy-6-metoxy-1,4-benzoquinol methylase